MLSLVTRGERAKEMGDQYVNVDCDQTRKVKNEIKKEERVRP